MSAPSLPDPVLISGPILIGAVASFLLFGGFLVQLYSYACEAVPGQNRWHHYLVGSIAALEVINICFIFHSAWQSVVLALGDPALALIPPNTAPVLQMLNGLMACLVQSFFGWRIYILSTRRSERILAGLIPLLGLTGLALAIAVGIQFIMLNSDGTVLSRISLTISLQLGCHLLTDALMTFGMVTVLWRYKERSMVAETRNLLSAITRNTLENGLATTVVATLNLSLFLARPSDNIHVAFHYLIGRLYANVLLTSLNSKRRPRSNSTSNRNPTSTFSNSRFNVSAVPPTGRAVELEEYGRGQTKTNPEMLISVSREVYVGTESK